MDKTVIEKTGLAIQRAIDTVASAGGGTVRLEPGVYLSGTIHLRDRVELHLPAGSEIRGFGSPDEYEDFRHPGMDAVAPEGSRKCLIAAAECRDIAVTGQGVLNGQGPLFYDTDVPKDSFFKKPPHPRPRLVQFYRCDNVRVQDVTLLDSPGWTCWLIECSNVNIARIRVEGCQQMINNDGIDIDACRRVTVSDSFFRTGDDCLILRALRRDPAVPSVCEEVVVNNCVLDSRCQGVRLGCPSDDTIRHCSFSNIVFRGRGAGIHTENPVRYLRKDCRGYLLIEDIRFSHLDIESGATPLRINCEDGIKLRGIRRLSFRDVRVRAGAPIQLLGNAETVLEDIELDGVSGVVLADSPIQTRYVRRLDLRNVTVTAETGEPVPFERVPSASWETKF